MGEKNVSEQDEQLLGRRQSDSREGKSMIQLNWQNVYISTNPTSGCCGKNKNLEPKVILDNVSGSVLPGQFLSIIGASGAGKTTLLNYLSGRLISQKLTKEGSVFVNGVDRDNIKGLSAYSAYVQQDDILF